MKTRHILLAATMLAAPFAVSHTAHAQPVNGAYVSLGLGDNMLMPYTIKGNGGRAKLLFSNGLGADAAVGYGLGNGFRVELEGAYQTNEAKKADGTGTGGVVAITTVPVQARVTGSENKYGGFVNGYYDFDIGLPYLYPYIGAGVGYEFVDEKGLGGPGGIDSTKGAFAYQGIVGAAYPIPGVAGLSATVEYRYIGVESRKYRNGFGSSTTFSSEGNNQLMVGLRYAFGVAPAPAPMAAAPVAAPAPAPAKTYLVFFDWDKYNLTPRANQIIAQAAADSKTNTVTKVDVSGYTDTSGTPTYNQGLSVRRAKAVAVKLMADGVPASEISIRAFGETHLLVPTGPGVREPQNRRVEIVLQ